MYMYISPPNSMIGKKEYLHISSGHDIFKTPWLWGWQKPISETKEYWILEKSERRYVFVYKESHMAFCYYNGKVRFYGRVSEFISDLDDELAIHKAYESARIEIEEINKKKKELEKEKSDILDYFKRRFQ